jgi:hypothetical protein
MKKQALSLVGVLSLLLAAGSAVAQSGALRADVPFNFTVNGTTMPAGPYTVSKTASTINTLLIQSDNSKEVNLVMPHRVESLKIAENSKLVFRCYSGRDHCFLYQIWVEGKNAGQEFPKTSLEKEVAAARLRSESVSVIASSR